MTNPEAQLPPGFRFHPTDEELILYYLRNQVISLPCPVSIIAEVDIYKFNPWDLPVVLLQPEGPQVPNGMRPNRAAASGYWKATGTDKVILTSGPQKENIGVKKALVFYKGRPPKGVKTSWIMNEYRLVDSPDAKHNGRHTKHLDSMRLDDWVLCRIYRRPNGGPVSSSGGDCFETNPEDSGFPWDLGRLQERLTSSSRSLSRANCSMMRTTPCYLGYFMKISWVHPRARLPSGSRHAKRPDPSPRWRRQLRRRLAGVSFCHRKLSKAPENVGRLSRGSWHLVLGSAEEIQQCMQKLHRLRLSNGRESSSLQRSHPTVSTPEHNVDLQPRISVNFFGSEKGKRRSKKKKHREACLFSFRVPHRTEETVQGFLKNKFNGHVKLDRVSEKNGYRELQMNGIVSRRSLSLG
ncbi:unnamed protein product [Spirodela intermedia]|uniref:NAC domain-containing protein n=1 Tax=Spirodela intermedia TaxID=51605 RepID=A0A7I8IAV1_SPIIN|nr:unnamed protein product [Spirodela intermedia]CAA6654524.1 unnamed protein product [Spirodela intermedia]